MTSQIEQWSLIFCVILPSMSYLMLVLLNAVDERRRN